MAKILIVEDENHIRRLIQVILEKASHETVLASSGEQALEILHDENDFDLILLDIMMPGIDGLQLLKKIKSNKTTEKIPVVMLTAIAHENVVLKGIELGAQDYIRKPFHPRELLDRVSPLLQKS